MASLTHGHFDGCAVASSGSIDYASLGWEAVVKDSGEEWTLPSCKRKAVYSVASLGSIMNENQFPRVQSAENKF